MSASPERFPLYPETSDLEPAEKRRIAVGAALELIHAEASGGAANPRALEGNMNNLSNYADQIQKALRVK